MGSGGEGWVQGYKIQSSELCWNFNSKYADLFAQVSDIGPSWSSCLYNSLVKKACKWDSIIP